MADGLLPVGAQCYVCASKQYFRAIYTNELSHES